MSNVSGIRKIFGTMAAKKSNGEKVFDYSLGNPGIEPLPEVREIIAQAVVSNGFGYSPTLGRPEIRESIANYYSKKHNLPFSASNAAVSHGATGSLHLIFGSIGEKGDNILFPTPLFGPPYKAWIFMHEKEPKTIRTNGNFHHDISMIEDAVDEKTRAIYINPMTNPTGKIYSKSEMDSLIEICRKNSLFLIVDNVYDGMQWKQGSSSHFDYENTIEINSISKKYSLAGSRVGWMILHSEIKEKEKIMAGATSMQEGLGYICPNMMSNAIPELLKIDEGKIKEHLRQYEKRIDILVSGLAETGYSAKKSESTFYAWFPAPENYRGDDMRFVMDALEKNLGLVHGSDFGPGGEGWVRASVGNITEKEIGESLEKFSELYKGC